jgi:hypothetical protein
MVIDHQYQYRNSLEPIFLSYRVVATLFQDLFFVELILYNIFIA